MKFRPVILSLIAAMTLTGCADGSVSQGHDKLSVDFLKVGKADAAIIRTSDHTVIIDCGEKSDGEKILNRLEILGSDKVDYMILTHYDHDHIGGAAKVIKETDVEHVISPDQELPDNSEASKELAKLREAMSKKKIEPELPDDTITFTLDDAEFQVFPCQEKKYDNGNDNNHSLIVRMTHHSKVFIFAGDALEERLSEVMDIGDCDVLKEPYHGRKVENLDAFLDKTTPEYAVISTDKKTLSKEISQLFSDKKIETFVTFRDGNIRCTSDGEKLWFETNK